MLQFCSNQIFSFNSMQLCYWSIDKLPGIKPEEQNLLKAFGINTTKQLLAVASNPQTQQTLATQLKLSNRYISKWVALADLARLPSVGCQYCGLLLHSGIASVLQLSQTSFPRLHRQIVKLHIATMQSKELSPSLEQVKQWIEEAKSISMVTKARF
ncbi:hypothetical protein Sta7437_1434 [Stanieria cyanosphaera PCC 7437]|uniref:DUF4332 domain-containing protein n=2 Tax=Stanieria cyanosphaera TaxID=102116 RepID=K9XSF4_STAC7|nr:hypothetical protein Sta7437_1434 [Stanieria cyanosphaera PCC 7437]